MIIRLVTYHALDGKDVERWMQTSASELRSIKGMRHLEFIRSKFISIMSHLRST